MTHEHPLVFLGYLVRDHDLVNVPHDPDIGTPGKVYWCRDCGTVIGIFSNVEGSMTPEWARAQLAEMETITRKILKQPKPLAPVKPSRTAARLGRGLADITESQQGGGHLLSLIRGTEDSEEED